MPEDDRDLYESFAALRREEDTHVRPISMLALTARGHGRRKRSGRLIAATMCLASLIAMALWLLPGFHFAHDGPNRGGEQADASITSWRPATDFLLDTPGRELLERVPAVGESYGVAIGTGHGEIQHPFRKRVLR